MCKHLSVNISLVGVCNVCVCAVREHLLAVRG